MTGIRTIIDDYVATSDFAHVEVGRAITPEEARRRHLIQSLLQADGLDLTGYRQRFGTGATEDFAPEIALLAERGFLVDSPDLLWLSPEGLAHSDAIGPALFSAAVRADMASYQLK